MDPAEEWIQNAVKGLQMLFLYDGPEDEVKATEAFLEIVRLEGERKVTM